MSDVADINQITQYLLGALPERETERLDELSITDDEFATALGSAELDLVDAYVHGELSGATLKQFESQFLASPLRREQVRFAQAFQNFAAKAPVTQPIDVERTRRETAVRQKSAGWFSALLAFRATRPALQWGLAVAALILLTGSVLLLFQNMRLREQINQTQARRDELQQREFELQKQLENQRTAHATTEQELERVREERARLDEQLKSGRPQSSPGGAAIVSLILTPQMRGVGQTKSVTISETTERVAIRLELEPNDYSTYSVTLIDQARSQTLWRSAGIKAAGSGDRKSLSVNFSAALLHSGLYRMQVSGIPPSGSPEVVGDYPFRVSK